MERDQKGVYEKALKGQATTVPGLQVPYEAPQQPEIQVDTEQQPPDECVREIVVRMEALGFLAS
jgi:adenylylsulfate kinase-like enzyme